MSKSTITKEELEVPLGVLIDVATQLIDNGINMEIVGTDEDTDCITLEVHYDKEQRETIHEVKDRISDFEESDEDKEDDDKD
jgi:hypothetical protein